MGQNFYKVCIILTSDHENLTPDCTFIFIFDNNSIHINGIVLLAVHGLIPWTVYQTLLQILLNTLNCHNI